MALISTSELAARLDDPLVRVLDARWYLDPSKKGIDAYSSGHIKGAFFADLDTDFAAPGGVRGGPIGRHPFPPAAQVQNVIRLFGIRPGIRVVAYDDASGAMGAARVWYVLRACGFDECDVLDGGIKKWIAEGREVTTQPPSVSTMTDFTVAPREGAVLTKADMIAKLKDLFIVDVRSGERYRGETEPMDPRAGHVPGAHSAPYADTLKGGDGAVFKSPAELRAQFAEIGIGQDTNPVVYCGSGITACHSLLALHVAGIEGRLYGGSWSEWSSDPALPANTGKEP